VEVPNRSAPTWKRATVNRILPGTHIVADKWKAYEMIEWVVRCIYRHAPVNHSENLVYTNPVTCSFTRKTWRACGVVQRRKSAISVAKARSRSFRVWKKYFFRQMINRETCSPGCFCESQKCIMCDRTHGVCSRFIRFPE